MRTDGAEEAVRVLLIDACPVLNADGTPVLREDGSPLYQLRNLHLSAALIARLKGEGYACVLFRLGDAALLIWLDELDDDDHIFTLGPILPGEATAGEEEAFGALAPLTDLHRVWARIDGAVVELSEVGFLLGAICESPAAIPEDTALYVYDEQTGLMAMESGQTLCLTETPEAPAPLWTLRLAPALETETKRLTFALGSPADGEDVGK